MAAPRSAVAPVPETTVDCAPVSLDLALDLALVLLGVALLYGGGELLVDGATALARRFGVSSLVVGLTVVAFGTSSPELAATLVAAARGVPEVAVGNVLGSNVANLGLILGASALFHALRSELKFIVREVPFMILCCAAMLPLALDGAYGRVDATLLLTALGVYLGVLVWEARRGDLPAVAVAEYDVEYGEAAAERPVWRSLLGVAVGVVLLAGGAHVLVEGAVGIARLAGVPDQVVGISLVALGTSLPELAACVVAALKREADIVLGNLVGSNVFNVLAILGVTALVDPLEVSARGIFVDYLVMMAFAVALLPILGLRKRVSRLEGAVLLVAYAVYIVWLYV